MRPLGLASIVVMLVACGGASPPARPIELRAGDGGIVAADLYGTTGPGVVLAPGAAFDRTSWRAFAEHLVAHGRRALAIDFRDRSRLELSAADVLLAVDELHRLGAEPVAVVGASLGGAAAATAVAEAGPGRVDRLVLLSPAPFPDPGRLRVPVLFLATEREPNVERVRELFRATPEPKRLLVLPGTAHAQHVFETDEAERLRGAVVDFLRAEANDDAAGAGAAPGRSPSGRSGRGSSSAACIPGGRSTTPAAGTPPA